MIMCFECSVKCADFAVISKLMLNLCPLLGETGLGKPRTNMAAPAPSVHQATEEAAETTSVTKVRIDREIRRCTTVSANNKSYYFHYRMFKNSRRGMTMTCQSSQKNAEKRVRLQLVLCVRKISLVLNLGQVKATIML